MISWMLQTNVYPVDLGAVWLLEEDDIGRSFEPLVQDCVVGYTTPINVMLYKFNIAL